MNDDLQELPYRVEFRFRKHEEDYARRLQQSAKDAGRTVSDQARELIKIALTSPDLLQHAVETLQQDIALLLSRPDPLPIVNDGLRTVHENIYQLRDDIAACVIKVLADAGHLDPETAEDWVLSTLSAD